MKKLILSAIVAATALTASAASATQAWVGQNHLNARSGPGTNYQVLGTFNPCTPVDVIEYQYGWAKIYYQNTYYWVSSKYLRNSACNYAAPKPTYTPPKKQYNNGYSGGSSNY